MTSAATGPLIPKTGRVGADACGDDLLPWFRLKAIPGIGNLICKRLIEALGSPEAVFAASPDRLLQVEGVSDRLARAIGRQPQPPDAASEIERARRSGCRILCLTSGDYPDLLRQIPDPPLLLYVKGDVSAAANPIAVVGSRRATRYGMAASQRLSAQLAAAGIAVVSGLALGIDTAAHKGALMAGGKTVAVLGSGLLRIYPPENEDLFHQIVQNGAVISEFALTAAPEARHFPQRNRIISGLSRGVVVVEAAARSGALITARLAAEQNREVFAVPGSIQSAMSGGTHLLIQQGAKLVAQVSDILEEIVPLLNGPRTFEKNVSDPPSAQPTTELAGLTAQEANIYRLLEPYPIHIDALARQLNMAPGALAAALLTLELKGLAVQQPGMNFALKV
jgi:DNA processing protein